DAVIEREVGADFPVVLHIPLVGLVVVEALAIGVGLIESLVVAEQHVGEVPARIAGVGGIGAEVEAAVVDNGGGLALGARLDEDAGFQGVAGEDFVDVVGDVLGWVLVVVRHAADEDRRGVGHFAAEAEVGNQVGEFVGIGIKKGQSDSGVG